MIGLDSNVLLRVFDGRDDEQTRAAKALIETSEPESLRLANLVVAEVVWTLKRRYRLPKAQLVAILHQLLAAPEMVFEDRGAVMTASIWFERGKADFADYLIAALNDEAGAHPTFTFDTDAALHPAFALLAP